MSKRNRKMLISEWNYTEQRHKLEKALEILIDQIDEQKIKRIIVLNQYNALREERNFLKYKISQQKRTRIKRNSSKGERIIIRDLRKNKQLIQQLNKEALKLKKKIAILRKETRRIEHAIYLIANPKIHKEIKKKNKVKLNKQFY